jgi:hypothetical protein
VPTTGVGSYRIIVEGCDSHFLSKSTCHQSWSSPLVLDLPSRHSCARSFGKWTFIDTTLDCGAAPMSRGFYVAVFRSSAGGSAFGLFEAADFVDHTPMSFDQFQQTTLQHNGVDPPFTATGENTYTNVDGRRIRFTPSHAASQWGIISMDNVSVPSDENAWRLAHGDIIDADGKGCVIIKNPATHKALVLDASDPKAPKPIVERPLTPTLSCTST